MCGIVYYHNLRQQNVMPQIAKRYKQQRSRGIDGFGLYLPEKDTLIHQTKERKMLRSIKRINASIALFHHRWPTSTDNVRRSCHPFSTKDFFKTNYILVHNGCITNDDELQKAHYRLGIKYISMEENGKFNDSEALLWDVALYLEGKQDGLKARGSIAFICYANTDKPKLYFGRNSYPLILRRNKKSVSLASEGEGENIDSNHLYTYNYTTNRLSKKQLTIPEYIYSATTFNYSNNYQDYDYRDHNTPTKKLTGTPHEIAMDYIRKAGGNFNKAFESLSDDLEMNKWWDVSNEELLDQAADILLKMWDRKGFKDDSTHYLWEKKLIEGAIE